MFIILSYDVKAKRVAKVKKTCSKYLVWVQNSVFEGNITDSKLSASYNELYFEIPRLYEFRILGD